MESDWFSDIKKTLDELTSMEVEFYFVRKDFKDLISLYPYASFGFGTIYETIYCRFRSNIKFSKIKTRTRIIKDLAERTSCVLIFHLRLLHLRDEWTNFKTNSIITWDTFSQNKLGLFRLHTKSTCKVYQPFGLKIETEISFISTTL